MKRKILVVAVAVLAVFAFSQVAFAAGWGGGPGGGPGMLSAERWVNLADTLNLTSEQADKVQELQTNHFNSTQELRDKMEQVMLEIRSLRWETGADQADFEAKLQELDNLRSQLNDMRQEQRNEMRAQFTDEQLDQMAENGCLGDGPRAGHRGMGGGPGFGGGRGPAN